MLNLHAIINAESTMENLKQRLNPKLTQLSPTYRLTTTLQQESHHISNYLMFVMMFIKISPTRHLP